MGGETVDAGLAVLQAFSAAALHDLDGVPLVVLLEEGGHVLLWVVEHGGGICCGNCGWNLIWSCLGVEGLGDAAKIV